MGVRVLRTKNSPGRLATRTIWLLHAAYGLVGPGLLAVGLWQIPAHGLGSRYLIYVILGAVGLADAREVTAALRGGGSVQRPRLQQARWRAASLCGRQPRNRAK